MHDKRACLIKSTVKILCPECGAIIELPMCKAVNGEEIFCPQCQKQFKFDM